MLDLINGLPVHVLVVHVVVVLLPLAVVGTIAIALVPGWRIRYGVLVVLVAAIGTALVPVATSSGEELERRVGAPGEHAELGDQLIWFALPLLVSVAALVWLAYRERARAAESTHAPHSTPRRLITVVAAVAVVLAVLNAVWVYRVGDSGARAAWETRVGATAAG